MYETIPLISFLYTYKLTLLSATCVSVPSTVMSTYRPPPPNSESLYTYGSLQDQGLKLNSKNCQSGINKCFQVLSHSPTGIS